MYRILALAASLAAFVPAAASARSFRLNQIPNPPNSCNTCHTMGGGTARNAFGLDVEATLNGTNVDWPAVCVLDSDDDGASNGLELGDPDCTWQAGDPNPPGPVFDPADDQSTPPVTDAGVSDVGGGADAEPPDDVGSEDLGAPDAGTPEDTGGSDPDTGVAPDAGDGTSPDAGSGPAPDSGTADGDGDEGCTCARPSETTLTGWLLVLPALAALRRRRR